MGKSLTETAKSILMNEGAVPSVSSSDNDPYRDATSTTVNKSSLRPGAKSAESRFSTPGATAPSTDAVDLGGATQTSRANENLGEKGSAKVGKDTSKSAKSAVPAEKAVLAVDLDLSTASLVAVGISDPDKNPFMASAACSPASSNCFRPAT